MATNNKRLGKCVLVCLVALKVVFACVFLAVQLLLYSILAMTKGNKKEKVILK